MICPVMSREGAITYCERDNCAWWNPDWEQCVVKDISIYLMELQRRGGTVSAPKTR